MKLTLSIKKKKSISATLLIYWVLLVAWQNISASGTKSTADIIVKSLLLVYLLWSFLSNSDFKIAHIIPLFLFFTTQLISFLYEKGISTNILVMYVFIIVSIVCVYGFGNNFKISRNEYIVYLRGVILVSLYCAVYAIIFCTSQFINAFRITNAYGNELSSFFSSSHEYGLYMSAGIIACVTCLVIDIDIRKRWIYIVGLIVFIPNLILTFSRTTIFATVVYFLSYVLFEKAGKVRKYTITAIVVIAGIYCLSPSLRSFTTNIILKRNLVGSRTSLYQLAYDMIANGSFREQLFGYGIYQSRIIFEESTTHGSVHNAYLQIILYFGWIGLLWLVAVFLSQIKTIIRIRTVNHFYFSTTLSLCLWAAVLMLTNTFIIFTSSIDSFFITIFALIIPKYICNTVREGTFDY